MIEFQPSAWSQGSFLNVGACWLWYEKDHLSFNAGYRSEGFRPFESEAQFAQAAGELAERAAQEVITLRERFSSPAQVCAWISNQPVRSIWDHYHLAVSAGLAGLGDVSAQAFAQVASHPDDRPWAEELKRRSSELRRCLEQREAFEAEIQGTIARARKLLKLPVVENREHHGLASAVITP